MGLESVELLMAFEEEFGIAIADEDAARMLTPAMVMDWICKQVEALPDRAPCFSMVEFHGVREAHFTKRGIPRRTVTLKSVLPGGWLSRRTVRDEVKRRVRMRASALMKRRKHEPQWTRSEVREAVREIIREQIGVHDFSDKDEFIRDLGLD